MIAESLVFLIFKCIPPACCLCYRKHNDLKPGGCRILEKMHHKVLFTGMYCWVSVIHPEQGLKISERNGERVIERYTKNGCFPVSS